MSLELAKKIFEEKKAAADAEREQERKNSVPKVLNPQGLAITVYGFFESEAEAFLACGGTARYTISEKQLFFLKWYNDQFPTTDLSALIREAEENPVCIYDWRNLSILLTELVEDFKAAKELQDQEQEVNFDAVPPHIRSRIEAKIK